MKSKVIALSAISASFIAIILFVGAIVDLIDILMITAASVFVTLPLYYKSYKGSVLCYLVGGTIGALLALGVGKLVVSIVIPSYFLFFGIYPITLRYMIKKNIKKAVRFVIGAVWCVGIVFGMYFYYINIIGLIENLPEIIEKNIYLVLVVFGLIFYFVYERFLFVSSKLTDNIIKRILKDNDNG